MKWFWFVLGGLLASGCDVLDARLLKLYPAPDRSDAGGDSSVEPPAPDGGGGDSGAAGTGASDAGGDSGALPSDAGDAGDADSGGGDGDGDGDGDSGEPDAGRCVPDAGVDVIDCIDPSLGWQKALTFDGSQLDSDLNGFPVLVRITDGDLAARAAQNGSDIHFVDETGSVTLAHEIERYDGSVGSLLAWVRLAALPAATDTVIYVRYGDAGPDRSNLAALWNDHHYVWHLAQDPGPGASGEIRDSTARAHGTARSTMASDDLIDAVVGKGIDFDGADDEITFVNDFSGTVHSTLSAWVNQRTDNDGASDTVLSFGSAMTGQTRLLYSTHASTNNVVGGFYNNDVDAGHSIENRGWHHIAWVWDGSASRFYVNGVLVGGPTPHSGADTVGTSGRIGNATWNPRFLRGQLDEVRVSSTARAAAWLKAEYDTQRSGSTFLKAVGAQQTVSPP